MKFKSMSVVAALAALVLSGWGNVAAAQVDGSATGRWAVVDSTTRAAKGTMFDNLDVPLYGVQMRFHGRVSGNVIGTVSALPRPGAPIFSLFGSYTVGTDGLTYFSTQLAIAVPNLGIPMFIMVGQFDGVLHRTPPVGGVNVPWKPATSGHFHGRWWHH